MAPEGKIKSKDLTYEASLPPFLQRLHAQKAGHGDPDRHERQLARPKRVQANDEEDGPTVVDESGETVSKEELARMTKQDRDEEAEPEPEVADFVRGQTIGDGGPLASGALQDGDASNRKIEQQVTDGTAAKKRKAAKVVGADDDDDDSKDENEPSRTTKPAKKVKKKAKAIKLAFDDGDDEPA